VQQPVGQDLDQPLPRRGHAFGHFADQPHPHPHPLGAEMLAHPQRHPHYHAARRQRIIGDPIDQAAQLFPQRRDVEFLADLLETVMQARIWIGVFGPHHADDLARSQRHAHDVARLQVHAAGRPIGIGLVERNRHQHVDDSRRRNRSWKETGAGGVVHQGIRPEMTGGLT